MISNDTARSLHAVMLTKVAPGTDVSFQYDPSHGLWRADVYRRDVLMHWWHILAHSNEEWSFEDIVKRIIDPICAASRMAGTPQEVAVA